MFHNADMRYPDVTDAKGEVHTLTDGTFVPMLMSADRTLRENAFKATTSARASSAIPMPPRWTRSSSSLSSSPTRAATIQRSKRPLT